MSATVFGLALMLGSLAPVDGPAKEHPFTGVWELVAAESNGKARDESAVSLHVAADGAYHIDEGKIRQVEGKIQRLDPDKSPREIDWTIASRSEFDGSFRPVRKQKGIYEREGDRLRLCFSIEEDAARPVGFESEKGKRSHLTRWKKKSSSKP